MDEDGPDDLNGDGFISVMRVKDPKGLYMVASRRPASPAPRRRAARRSGGWSVYWEGTDNDGDGFINEDGPGGVDLNRNFQHQYPYYTPDAGPHMVSEPETRARDGLHPQETNVAAILTYGASDNLIAPPTGQGRARRAADARPARASPIRASLTRATSARSPRGQEQLFFGSRGGDDDDGPAAELCRRRPARPAVGPAPRPPATTVAPQDVEYFRTISDRYRALTGRPERASHADAGRRVLRVRLLPVRRAVLLHAWLGRSRHRLQPRRRRRRAGGAARCSGGRPWRWPGRAVAEGAAAGRRRTMPPGTAAFDFDAFDGGRRIADGFIAWTPFTHPTLGAVEIGGFKPYTVTNPPASPD